LSEREKTERKKERKKETVSEKLTKGRLPMGAFSSVRFQLRPFSSNGRELMKILIVRFRNRGCQMVCFQTKYPNLGKFLRALDCNMLM
jgi:hypothetical protein